MVIPPSVSAPQGRFKLSPACEDRLHFSDWGVGSGEGASSATSHVSNDTVRLNKADRQAGLIVYFPSGTKEDVCALTISLSLSAANCKMEFDLAYGGKATSQQSLGVHQHLQLNNRGPGFHGRR